MTGLEAAGYFWLALLVAVAVFEAQAVLRHRPTLSQWVWSVVLDADGNRRNGWFVTVVVGAVAFLMLHFFLLVPDRRKGET